MESKGYKFVGEKNFSREGDVIPCEKKTWTIGSKDYTFTNTGFLFFKHNTNCKRNIAFYLYCHIGDSSVGMKCYSTCKDIPSQMLNDLDMYTKKYNCLRGCRLKDVNLMSAEFTEIEIFKDYKWDKFYFSQNVIDLVDEEIVGFLSHIKKYNDRGLNKRGVLFWGEPGCGKTTIGKVLCNCLGNDTTVIWITPDSISENSVTMYQSIKLLYKLADYVSPSAVIIEDLDLFTTDREMGGDNLRLGSLMNILDGVNSIPNTITIATTNRLNVIENALRNRPGRFDRIVQIPALEEPLRKKMIQDRLSNCIVTPEIISLIVRQTEGWTGAEIQELVHTINIDFIVTDDTKLEVTSEKVDKAFKRIHAYGIGKNGKIKMRFGV
jgi:hypothetical protein